MEKRSAALAVLLLASVLLLATAQDETDDILLPSQGNLNIEWNGAGAGDACCNHCSCTKRPPVCQCLDVLIGSCRTDCRHCVCTKSHPPRCRCTDVKLSCGPHCHA